MATMDDVAAIASSLPGVEEGERHGTRTWFVGKKAFAWERGFSKADVKRFGDETPPSGPIAAVLVADLAEKEAVLAANSKGIFTITHFDGYPAVLIQLQKVGKRTLREAMGDEGVHRSSVEKRAVTAWRKCECNSRLHADGDETQIALVFLRHAQLEVGPIEPVVVVRRPLS